MNIAALRCHFQGFGFINNEHKNAKICIYQTFPSTSQKRVHSLDTVYIAIKIQSCFVLVLGLLPASVSCQNALGKLPLSKGAGLKFKAVEIQQKHSQAVEAINRAQT